MQVQGKPFRVTACGFKAGMDFNDALLNKPAVELFEPFWAIFKLLVSEFVISQKRYVKCLLSYVDTQEIQRIHV